MESPVMLEKVVKTGTAKLSIEEIDVNEFDIVIEEGGMKRVFIPSVDTFERAKVLVNNLIPIM